MRLNRGWVLAAAALILIGVGYFAISHWTGSSPAPDAGQRGRPAEPVEAPPATHLEPGETPPRRLDGDAATSGKVSVEILAKTEDGLPATIVVYGGPSPTALQPVETVSSGEPKVVEVPDTYLHWFASVAKSDRALLNYNSTSLRVKALQVGSRVALRIPRAPGVLRVTAHDLAGRPVALVVLELGRAPTPRWTQVITGADGQASWEGIRGDLISSDGVKVVDVPNGFQLLQEPTVNITREPNSSRIVASAEIVLDRCSAGFNAALSDTRYVSLTLETRSGSTWVKVSPTPDFEVDPPAVAQPPPFAEDSAPRPGTLRCRGLCPGESRVTVFGSGGVLGVTTAVLSAREISELTLIQPKFVHLSGRVVGPATGNARLLDLSILEVVEPAAQLAGEVLPLPVRRDGTFDVLLPEGVRQVSITGVASGPTPYILIPSVRSVGARLEVESLKPGTLRGRIVDPKGRGLPGVGVGAVVEPVDSRGQFVAARTGIAVTAVRTKEDGSWTLGPGCPGTWLLTIEASGQPRVTKRIPVVEGADDDLGSIPIGK